MRTSRGGRLVPIIALAALAVVAGGCDLVEQMQDGRKYDARIRVESILGALVTGDHLSKQKFTCLFGKGSISACSPGEMARFYEAFLGWLKKKKIHKGIDSWEMVDYWEDPDFRSRAFHFHVKIDGKDAHLTVHDRGHMEWAKTKVRPDD